MTDNIFQSTLDGLSNLINATETRQAAAVNTAKQVNQSVKRNSDIQTQFDATNLDSISTTAELAIDVAATAERAARNKEAIVKSANAQITPIRDGVLARRNAAEEARRLTDSGRFSDRVNLGLKTILQPGLFNPELRAKRNQEDAATLSLLGATTDAELNALQAQLDVKAKGFQKLLTIEEQRRATEKIAAETGITHNNNLVTIARSEQDIAIVQEEIALERANRAGKKTEALTNTIANELQLVSAVVSSLTAQEVDAALNSGIIEGTDRVEVNGVQIPLADLNNRQVALRERQFANLVTAEGSSSAKLLELAQKKVLGSMTQLELEALQNNNNTDDAGNQFPREMVQQNLQIAQQAQANKINASVRDAQLASQPQTALTSAAQQMTNLSGSLGVSSPLQNTITATRIQLGNAQAALDSGDPLAALAITDQAIKQFEIAAVTQAKREAFGDKATEALLTDFFTTGQVNANQVIEVASDRLSNGKSLVGLFPEETRRAIQDTYNSERLRLTKEATEGSPFQKLSNEEQKSLKRQAAEIAITQGGQNSGIAVATFAESKQVEVNGNPLQGKLTSGEMQGLRAASKTRAISVLSEQFNIDPSKVRIALSSGEVPEAMREAFPDFKTFQSEAGFLAVAALQEQLGNETSDALISWAEREGVKFIDQLANSLPGNGEGFSRAAGVALSAEVAREEWLDYATTMASVSKSRQDQMAEKAAALTEQTDVVRTQELLLSSMSDLTPEDKKALWPLILAEANRVRQTNIPRSDVNTEILRRLNTINTKNFGPSMQRAIKLYSAQFAERTQLLKDLGNTLQTGAEFTKSGGQ